MRAPQGRLPSSQRDLGGLERGDSRGAFPQTVAEPAAAGARLGQQWPGVALFACSAPALSKPLASSLLSLSPFLSRLFASSLLSRILVAADDAIFGAIKKALNVGARGRRR